MAAQTNQGSLKKKLMLWVLVPLTLVLIVSALISYYRALHFSNLAYDRSLFRAALALADQVDVVNETVVINLPQVAKDLLEYDKDDIVYYRISAPDGHLVLGEEALHLPSLLPKAGNHRYYDDKLKNDPVRVVAFSLPIENSPLTGNILVQVAETKAKRQALVTEIVKEMLLTELAIILLALALIFFGITHGLKPLHALQLAIHNRSHRDLSDLSTDTAPGEIQPLLQAMNGLLRRLREAIQLQQQFVADASHQLRTPVAGLKTQAELALRATSQKAAHEHLTLIQASADRLSHLLQRLLSMAAVDSDSGRALKLSPINLAALARETTEDFIPSARKKSLDLGLDIQAPQSTIIGDAQMLREMLSNLIDNTICYTPSQGIITVSVHQTKNQVVLSVTDSGAGIPSNERARVFERFHRLVDNDGQGCGLGLAIVKEIATAHNAEVQISDGLPSPTSANGFGTCVNVIFNLGASPDAANT